jgi:hypothetical protein
VGEHYFKVEPLEGGAASRLVHGEEFSGLLMAVAGGMLRAAEKGFNNMNAELKKRVEAAP